MQLFKLIRLLVDAKIDGDSIEFLVHAIFFTFVSQMSINSLRFVSKARFGTRPQTNVKKKKIS